MGNIISIAVLGLIALDVSFVLCCCKVSERSTRWEEWARLSHRTRKHDYKKTGKEIKS